MSVVAIECPCCAREHHVVLAGSSMIPVGTSQHKPAETKTRCPHCGCKEALASGAFAVTP